jgi:hypothetical protein
MRAGQPTEETTLDLWGALSGGDRSALRSVTDRRDRAVFGQRRCRTTAFRRRLRSLEENAALWDRYLTMAREGSRYAGAKRMLRGARVRAGTGRTSAPP